MGFQQCCGGSEEGNAGKVDICHLDDEEGIFKLIKVNKNAKQAHINHGDGHPDGPYPDLANAVFGPDCQPKCAIEGCEECEFQENVGFECKCFTGTATEVTTWCTENNKNCCNEAGACSNFQGTAEGTATICKGACKGPRACYGIGQLKIGVNACDGDYSCRLIAGGLPASGILPGSGEIGSGACVGRDACNGVGQYVAETVSIAENACSGGSGDCYNYGATCTGTVTIDAPNVLTCVEP